MSSFTWEERTIIEKKILKHYPIVNPQGSRLFEEIVKVCFFAGYKEKDIIDICNSLSNSNEEIFQQGIDSVNRL